MYLSTLGTQQTLGRRRPLKGRCRNYPAAPSWPGGTFTGPATSHTIFCVGFFIFF